jgi:hypothetical protein
MRTGRQQCRVSGLKCPCFSRRRRAVRGSERLDVIRPARPAAPRCHRARRVGAHPRPGEGRAMAAGLGIQREGRAGSAPIAAPRHAPSGLCDFARSPSGKGHADCTACRRQTPRRPRTLAGATIVAGVRRPRHPSSPSDAPHHVDLAQDHSLPHSPAPVSPRHRAAASNRRGPRCEVGGAHRSRSAPAAAASVAARARSRPRRSLSLRPWEPCESASSLLGS